MAHPFQEFIDAVSKHLTELNTHTQAFMDPPLSDRVSDGGRRPLTDGGDEAMASIRASAAGLQAKLSALTAARPDVTDPRSKRPSDADYRGTGAGDNRGTDMARDTGLRPGDTGYTGHSAGGAGYVGTAGGTDAEKADFDRATTTNTAAGWDAFMAKYPNGRFKEQAKMARAKF